jgi:hypothetical protein
LFKKTKYKKSCDNKGQLNFLTHIPLTTKVNNLRDPNKLGLFVQ